jgi:hypothetical protein
LRGREAFGRSNLVLFARSITFNPSRDRQGAKKFRLLTRAARNF